MLIAGGSPTHHFGKSLQELSQHGFEDVANVLRPVVKRAWLQVRPDTVLDTLNQAYKIATTGRPGPVFIYLPLDILQVEVEPEREIVAPRGVTSRLRPDEASINEVVKLLGEAERPVLVAGGGIGHSPGGISALQIFCGASANSRRHDTDRQGRTLRRQPALPWPCWSLRKCRRSVGDAPIGSCSGHRSEVRGRSHQ